MTIRRIKPSPPVRGVDRTPWAPKHYLQDIQRGSTIMVYDPDELAKHPGTNEAVTAAVTTEIIENMIRAGSQDTP